MCEHQFSHVLTTEADELGNVSQAYEIRSDFDQLGVGNGTSDIFECADHRLPDRPGITREVQCDPAGLPDSNGCVIAARCAKLLYECVHISAFSTELEFHSEIELHDYSSSSF